MGKELHTISQEKTALTQYSDKSLINGGEINDQGKQSTLVGSWEWDIEKGELNWSEHTEQIFGINKKEADNTYEAFLKFVHPEDLHYVMNAIEGCIKKDRNCILEHR